MSYSRENGTVNYIVFYYERQTIFNKVSLLTLYRAKNILNESGESQIENFAMTEDEDDAFMLFAKEAVEDAFSIVLKMTTGLTDKPVFFNETIVIDPSIDIPNVYGFKIVDHDAYNVNNLITVDSGVREYINFSIISDWYSMVGHKELYAEWLAKKEDMRRDLINKRLFQLKKPLISHY